MEERQLGEKHGRNHKNKKAEHLVQNEEIRKGLQK